MKRKIPCFCDNAFSVDVPDEIDLDKRPEYIAEIMDGTFMNFICPSCGKKHKPEFPITVNWPRRMLRIEVLPELERGEFYRRKKKAKKGETKNGEMPPLETVIGYPELADRIAVIRDGLEPAAVEALKYYLLLKAEENLGDDQKEPGVWYQGKTGEEKGSSGESFLEFHIHGLREEEVAVTRIPRAIYEKTLDDYKKHPKSEMFSILRSGAYLSVQNALRPDILK
ncbi:MAG: CpXC domain-containing protein [Treponema sp.]|nr:CpXC domain-containing protein [Treponema sp.]